MVVSTSHLRSTSASTVTTCERSGRLTRAAAVMVARAGAVAQVASRPHQQRGRSGGCHPSATSQRSDAGQGPICGGRTTRTRTAYRTVMSRWIGRKCPVWRRSVAACSASIWNLDYATIRTSVRAATGVVQIRVTPETRNLLPPFICQPSRRRRRR